MKEYLTSLRFVPEAILPVMYFVKTRFQGLALIFAVFITTALTLSAQSNDPSMATLSLTPVLEMNDWKSPVEYSSVILSMKESTAQKLAEPNLQVSERALYTGFERLLSYIQVDLEAQAEINKIAETNYSKVVKEAPSDPLLINMHMDEFQALYELLVSKLRP